MSEPKGIDFQKEAYYLMRSANFQMRNAFMLVKEMIDSPTTSPEETIVNIRKMACNFVSDKNQD